MKNSNKLLLAGFLILILLISAIHISLYAKYQNGDYTIYNMEDDVASNALQSFPNILFVSVRNVPEATVKFSDVASVEKDEEGVVSYVQKGDTLLITGIDSRTGQLEHPLTFNLPANAALSAFNSSLSFRVGKNKAAVNPVIYLQKSRAFFSGSENGYQLGRLKVIASDSSFVGFQGNTQLDQLEVQLNQSSLECGDGNFGQLSIITDSVSRLSLQTKHLLKADIKNTSPQ